MRTGPALGETWFGWFAIPCLLGWIGEEQVVCNHQD